MVVRMTLIRGSSFHVYGNQFDLGADRTLRRVHNVE